MKDRINEIKSAIIEYCRENLNEQYKDISLDVLAKIEQKDGEILNSSRCDIWVASILNIVLEDAEMFKRKHPMYITKKAFSEKTGVSSKTIKGKSDILRALLDCEQEASAEVAATAETVENNIEALNAEEVKVDTKKELTEEETKSAKYKALMGLAHEDLPFEDRLDYFKQAMAVAEEMIVDRENTTNFWNNESARPYMIASQDLATLLINNKNYKEAREILELLIKMDEDDTQGNRFKLINLLIAKNDRKAVNELFAKFKNEDSVQGLLQSIILLQNGNLYFAKSAIKDGVNKNKYIGLFLMQWTAALRMSGSVIDPVLYTEATYYYNENFALWKDTKGALKWLVNAVIK